MKLLIILTLALICNCIYSQDQLFKKDNTKTDVKVLEINQTEIKYKLFTYLDGPTIIISKKDVAMIIYKNGEHQVFNEPIEAKQIVIYQDGNNLTDKKTVKIDEHFDDYTSTKNVLGTNVLEPLNGGFNITYLREFTKYRFHLYVPFSVGFTEPYLSQSTYRNFTNSNYSYNSNYNYGSLSNFKLNRKVAEFGLGIHFQASARGLVTYFIGPYYSLAQFNGSFVNNTNIQVYNQNTGYYYSQQQAKEHSFVMNRHHFMINNGVLFRVNKNFNVLLLLGIGVKKDVYVANGPKEFVEKNYPASTYSNYYNPSNYANNSLKFGLTMGYRF